MKTKKTAVFMVNIGSPEAPTPEAVKSYLWKFLSDRRVVDLPRWRWLPILKLFVLPRRSVTSAAAYQKIWLDSKSPLVHYTELQAEKVQARLNELGYEADKVTVFPAFSYCQPEFKKQLQASIAEGFEKWIVLPMFPQYSSSTTGAVYDQMNSALAGLPFQPEISFINSYHTHTKYISALAESINEHWHIQGNKSKLLISFHGLPRKFIEKGDPYQKQCAETIQALVQKLLLKSNDYLVGYQSRPGRGDWLTPYSETMLEELGKKKLPELTVICPGFASDCLETLEEIEMRGKKLYYESGGKKFRYVAALNDQENHIDLLTTLITERMTE